MSALYILLGVSLLVAFVFLGVFIWAIKTGQFEDGYTPSVRILFDDKLKDSKSPQNTENT